MYIYSFLPLISYDYWQVKISGGGRCNVTNGLCTDHMVSFVSSYKKESIKTKKKKFPCSSTLLDSFVS